MREVSGRSAYQAHRYRARLDVTFSAPRTRFGVLRCTAVTATALLAAPGNARVAATTTVPLVLELSSGVAAAKVANAGLKPKFTGVSGPNDYVAKQSPAPGKVVPVGSVVSMHLRTGPVP
jgi:beta-lactam-binding protein with PASTA domain